MAARKTPKPRVEKESGAAVSEEEVAAEAPFQPLRPLGWSEEDAVAEIDRLVDLLRKPPPHTGRLGKGGRAALPLFSEDDAWSEIEDMVHWYVHAQGTGQKPPRWADVRNQLAQLAEDADALRKTLDGMNPLTRALVHPRPSWYSSSPPEDVDEPFIKEIARDASTDVIRAVGRNIAQADVPRLREALAALGNLSRELRKLFPRDRGGRGTSAYRDMFGSPELFLVDQCYALFVGVAGTKRVSLIEDSHLFSFTEQVLKFATGKSPNADTLLRWLKVVRRTRSGSQLA